MYLFDALRAMQLHNVRTREARKFVTETLDIKVAFDVRACEFRFFEEIEK